MHSIGNENCFAEAKAFEPEQEEYKRGQYFVISKTHF